MALSAAAHPRRGDGREERRGGEGAAAETRVDGVAELKGGVERRQKRRTLGGEIKTPGEKVLKDRRSPRRRGRMGTSVQNAPGRRRGDERSDGTGRDGTGRTAMSASS
eukprot:29098-Pelagococcus_subviridis.AAC.4